MGLNKNNSLGKEFSAIEYKFTSCNTFQGMDWPLWHFLKILVKFGINHQAFFRIFMIEILHRDFFFFFFFGIPETGKLILLEFLKRTSVGQLQLLLLSFDESLFAFILERITRHLGVAKFKWDDSKGTLRFGAMNQGDQTPLQILQVASKCKQQNWRKHLVWGCFFRQTRHGRVLMLHSLIIPRYVTFSPKNLDICSASKGDGWIFRC